MDEANLSIKAVVFDVGGVIELNEGGGVWEYISELLDVPLDDFKKAYWAHNHLSNVENMKWEDMIIEVVRTFKKDKKTEDQIRKFIRAHEAKKKINVELLKIFPQLRRKGLKVGILSNATSELRDRLKQKGVTPLVDELVISGEIGYQKPHKEAFDILFQRLGLKPEQVVFVDDSLKSLEKADEIGYIPIQFKNNGQLKLDLEKVGIHLI
jgi:epoxide hydrolase-like predicted phosphatase